MAKKTEKTFYRVHYRDPQDGQHQSIKAENITDSSLGLSFVALSNFIFETNSILVHPEEEAKKLEFEHVKIFHLSIYSILSIAEIGEHEKDLNFKNDKSNLIVLNKELPGNPSN